MADSRHGVPQSPQHTQHSPCSLEISGLYQYLEVSWTNFTLARVSGLLSKGGKERKVLWVQLCPQRDTLKNPKTYIWK